MNLIKKVGGSVVEVSCKLSQSDQITNIFRKKAYRIQHKNISNFMLNSIRFVKIKSLVESEILKFKMLTQFKLIFSY